MGLLTFALFGRVQSLRAAEGRSESDTFSRSAGSLYIIIIMYPDEPPHAFSHTRTYYTALHSVMIRIYPYRYIRFHILHWILLCLTDANYAILTATIVTSKTPSNTPTYANKIYSLLHIIIIISWKLERPRSYLPAADEYGVYCRNSSHSAITAIRVCIIIIW